MKTQKKSIKSKVAICKSIASKQESGKKKSRKIKVAIASIAASTALLLGGGFALSTAIKAKQDLVVNNIVSSQTNNDFYKARENYYSDVKNIIQDSRIKERATSKHLEKYNNEFFDKLYSMFDNNVEIEDLLQFIVGNFEQSELDILNEQFKNFAISKGINYDNLQNQTRGKIELGLEFELSYPIVIGILYGSAFKLLIPDIISFFSLGGIIGTLVGVVISGAITAAIVWAANESYKVCGIDTSYIQFFRVTAVSLSGWLVPNWSYWFNISFLLKLLA